MALVTAPMLTLVFLAIMEHAGRRDLAPFAVLAPALLVLWQMALLTSGDTIASERENGSLEALIATPSSLSAVISGRISAVTAVSMVGFAESWLVAALVFDVRVAIEHPPQFVLTLLVTAYATAGTAVMLAALFVATRSARAFQNSLSYPIFVLGGVMVPVAFLPVWLQPVTKFVFLSWSSDLLRESLQPMEMTYVAPRLGAVLALGTLGLIVGEILMRRALARVRRTGSLSYA